MADWWAWRLDEAMQDHFDFEAVQSSPPLEPPEVGAAGQRFSEVFGSGAN